MAAVLTALALALVTVVGLYISDRAHPRGPAVESELTLAQAQRQLRDYITRTVSVLPSSARLEQFGGAANNPSLCDESDGADPSGPRQANAWYQIKGLAVGQYSHYFDLVVAYWQSHGWVVGTDKRTDIRYYFVNAKQIADGFGLAVNTNPANGFNIVGNSPCVAVPASSAAPSP